MHFILNIILNVQQKSLQDLSISDHSSLKRQSPSGYKHLALCHLMAPTQNVGTINKLYYSTLTFQ